MSGPREGNGLVLQAVDQAEFVQMPWAAQPSQLQSVRRSLHRWLVPLLAASRADEIILAVGEAVANSVEHAYAPGDVGDVSVTFWIDSDAVWIEVCDHGRWQPPDVTSS